MLSIDQENIEANEGIEKCKIVLEKINVLRISAQELYDEGKYREAITKWKEVLNVDPENQTARVGLEKAEGKIREKEEKIKPEERLQVKKYCPRCGHPNTRRLNYCVNCGAKLFWE